MKWLDVHIGGQRWGVYLVGPKSKYLLNEERGFDSGKCHYDKCRIAISKALDEQAREDTLWHELLHALLYVTGAEKVYDCDADKDEELVAKLTPAMHRLLKDLGFRFPRGPYL